MIATQLAAFLQRRGIHYGWVVIGVTFLTMLSTAGAVGLPGAFILPFEHEFGWNPGSTSLAFGIRLALYGLMGPFAAALIERYGARRIVVTAVTLICTGLLGAFAMTKVWHLVVLWGIVVGVGTGLTALVLGAIISSRWFTARRGLVVGLLTASSATGQLVFLPLVTWLIDAVGWRLALLPPIAALIVSCLLVLLLLRDRPSEVGLAPYGETTIKAAAPPATQTAPAITQAFQTLKSVAPSPVFWVLAFTFFICGLSTAGLVQTHFIPLCVDFGMPQVQAASALAMMGVFDFVGTILSGWLSDRYDNRWLLFWYYGLRGLSLIFLPFSTFSLYGLSLFALFYGLDWIATVPPTVKLTGATFGRERAGLVFGWVFASHQLGAAVAAWGGGLSRTIYASYLPAFYVAGFSCLVAAALVLTLRNRPASPVMTAPATS